MNSGLLPVVKYFHSVVLAPLLYSRKHTCIHIWILHPPLLIFKKVGESSHIFSAVYKTKIILTWGFFLLSTVPGAPPRRVEVEVLNSTALKVMWRSLTPGKQNGQIRGYQVHYVRVENGESRGLPLIKDVMLADAQVWPFHGFDRSNVWKKSDYTN